MRTGPVLGSDYTEVRFEQLVSDPRQLLAKLAPFVDHDLDYDRIQEVGIGSVSNPNTAFATTDRSDFHPVGRWKKLLSSEQLRAFEGLVGGSLVALGYQLTTPRKQLRQNHNHRVMRLAYRSYFSAKDWVKARPGLSSLLLRAELPTEQAG